MAPIAMPSLLQDLHALGYRKRAFFLFFRVLYVLTLCPSSHSQSETRSSAHLSQRYCGRILACGTWADGCYLFCLFFSHEICEKTLFFADHRRVAGNLVRKAFPGRQEETY